MTKVIDSINEHLTKINSGFIVKKRAKENEAPKTTIKRKYRTIYAYYYKDELICVGTQDEVAKFTKTKREVIKFYSTPSGDRSKNGIKVIKWRELTSSNYDITEDIK